jgi:hypothetical protein
MKKIYTYFVCAVVAQLCSTCICNAQTLDLKPAPAGVTVDGNAKEWGDNMSYTDTKTKISYTLANDKENLYLVVKTKDPTQISSMLGAGISLSIDTKGRKKNTYVVTYPASLAITDQSRYVGMPPQRIQSSADYATKYGKIHAEGFKDVSEEPMPTLNPYAIQAAVSYDAASGYLVYEEAIPLAIFHAGDLLTKEWAFNIKLNPVQGKAKADRGSKLDEGKKAGAKDAGRSAFEAEASKTVGLEDITDEVDFWGKFTLAKAQ